MKKVLILTSIKTGSGHRASSNAIEKKLKDAGFETRQLDVFEHMGGLGRTMEGSYMSLTTHYPWVYYICQRFSEYFPDIIHLSMYLKIRKNLLEQIKEYGPDLIISVHCMFTKAISKIIARYDLNIPFYVVVIDLVYPPSVWRDKRADIVFVPTEKIQEDYLARGFMKEKVLVSGFPVRDDIIVPTEPKKITDRINILMVNASTDLNKNIRFVQESARLDNVRITFICGLDERLYKTLVKMKENREIRDDIEIYGFVGNMNEFLSRSHIIMTKAGPNVIIESIRSGTAIVICGHIHGQEDDNYRYVIENGYGIKCEDPERIYDELSSFINDGLKDCLDSIAGKQIGNGAEYIADYVRENI